MTPRTLSPSIRTFPHHDGKNFPFSEGAHRLQTHYPRHFHFADICVMLNHWRHRGFIKDPSGDNIDTFLSQEPISSPRLPLRHQWVVMLKQPVTRKIEHELVLNVHRLPCSESCAWTETYITFSKSLGPVCSDNPVFTPILAWNQHYA